MLECRPDTAAGDDAMTVSKTGSIMTRNSMVTTTFNLKSRKDPLISGTYDISHYDGTVFQVWNIILFLSSRNYFRLVVSIKINNIA